MVEMASSAMLKMVCVALMGLVLLAPQGEAVIPCSTVYSSLYPCLNYVMGTAPLQDGCCKGIKGLYGQAKTSADRQSVCSCLKSLASNAGNANISKAQALPGQCGVNLPYKISPKIDCSKVY